MWPKSLFEKNKKPTVPKAPDTQSGPTLVDETKKAQKKYDRAIWWVRHEERLKMIGVYVLIVFEIVIGLIGVWAYVDYFLIDYVEEQRLVEGFFIGSDDLRDNVTSSGPAELAVKSPTVLLAGKTYDILAFATNENPQWAAQVTYHFEYGSRQSEPETVIILQDSTLPLVEFQVESPRPSSPNLLLDEIEWYRIDQHDIPHPVEWKQERLNLEVTEVVHDNNFRVGDRTFGKTNFTVTNDSGYGYYEIEAFIVLKRGTTPVAVNSTVMTDLMPTESRPIQLNWFANSPSASSVELYPMLNLFDGDVYRPESAEVDVDVRDALIKRR